MMNGMTGRWLWVNLSTGQIETKPLERWLIEGYIGGRGINARMLWDLTEPGIDPLGPDNPLIFGTGSLGGTFAPNSGRMTITCKSPATNLYLKTNVGSHLVPELKFAGLDGITVTGKSDHPVYLWIDDGQVELRDAEPLWGLDTRETDRWLKEELKDDQIKTLMIGPAGENLVKFASIMVSIYRAAGRGGAGAVMGSKNLKAIAVRGTGDITVDQPERFIDAALSARKSIREDDYCWTRSFKFGTAQGVLGANESGTLPHNNFQDGFVEDGYKLSGEYVSERYAHPEACSSCVLHCGRFARINSGRYAGTYTAGPEYETLASLGSKCGITDTEAVIKGNELCDILGMDTISAGSMISFAMECNQHGLLTPEQVKGLDLSWGNADVMLDLIRKMAIRDGDFADLLAEGTRTASETIGGGAERFAIQAKGLEQSMVDTRGTMSYALAFALNPRGPDHLTTECLAEVGYTPEVRNLAIKITGTEKGVDSLSAEGKPKMVAWHEDIYAVSDCVGICVFTNTWSYRITMANMAEMFSAATGIELSEDEARHIGERIVTLERLFNLREGLTRRELDVVPLRMFDPSPTLADGKPTLTKEKLDGMLEAYYVLRGWDESTGVPTSDKLDALQLPSLRSDDSA